jgi:hypothetical protein
MKTNAIMLLAVGAMLIGCTQDQTSPATGTAAGTAAAQVSPAQASTDGAFVHTVFFWMHEGATEADRQQLWEGLNSLRDVEQIQQLYAGVPAPTDRPVIDSSYDYSLTMIFADQAAQDAYQVHPVHEAFVANYAHLWDRVVVYDAVSPDL